MKTNRLWIPAQVCIFLALWWTLAACGGGSSSPGCGSNCPPGSKPELLYATSLNQVQILTVNPSTGALSTATAVSGPNLSIGIKADPAAKFLYVSDFQNDAVDAFSINPSSGALTPAGSPFPVGVNPPGAGGLAMDPAGKFLYATDVNANSVAAFTVSSSTGALTAVGSPFPAGNTPVQATVDPSGKFLYASNNGDPAGSISAYTINSKSGALTPVQGSAFSSQGLGPGGLVVVPSGKFLYVALTGTVNPNDLVAGFTIDSAGALTPVAGSPFLTGNGPLLVAVDPAGKFLYTSNSADATISAFTINATTGFLTPVGTFQAGTASEGLVIDPSGKFLYSSDPGSNSILTFSIASTGALTAVGQPVIAGQQPLLLTIAKVP